jgi:hypothetical protein
MTLATFDSLFQELSTARLLEIVGYPLSEKNGFTTALGVWGCPKLTLPKSAKCFESFGERGRIRTCDPCLKRALLYHLSYAPHPSYSKSLL